MVYDEIIFSTCPSAAKIILVPAGDYYISLLFLRPIRLPMLRAERAHVTRNARNMQDRLFKLSDALAD